MEMFPWLWHILQAKPILESLDTVSICSQVN